MVEQSRVRPDFFFFAGEESGDQLGGYILKHLQEYHSIGVGGSNMMPYLRTCIDDIKQYQWMGFSEVVKNLPTIYRKIREIAEAIVHINPRVLVCIDFPDFVFQLIKQIKKKGYQGKIIQVVCPQFWAWRKKRKAALEKYFDALCVLFPFEKDIFNTSPLPCKFIGHPLATEVLKFDACVQPKYISIFPGSRQGEIKHNLPLQLEAAKQYCKDNPSVTIAVCAANYPANEIIQSLVDSAVRIVGKEDRHHLMRESVFAIATSGTITLELGLCNVPTVVTYKMGYIDQWVAQHLLRIRRHCFALANILLEKKVYEEWIGPHCTKENILNSVRRLASKSFREAQKQDLLKLNQQFEGMDPGLEAAVFLKQAQF